MMDFFQLVKFFPSPWMNVLAWMALLSVPPLIVLLYFLKLKRQPLEVPSTYLWSRTIEDLHVNSIWQKLRQNLLLFLQLLLLLLIIIACFRPGYRSNRLTGNRFVFLIDTSASMSAADVGGTRLEKAKEKAIYHVDGMKAGDVAMVIGFSDTTGEIQSFTNDKRLLKDRINGLQQTSHSTDLDEAIRAAAGLANPGRSSDNSAGSDDVQVAQALPATIYIFSDGGFREVQDFALQNLSCEFVPVGDFEPPLPTTEKELVDFVPTFIRNVGVVAFTIERNPDKPSEIQAYARFENHGPEDVTIEPDVYFNGEVVAQTVVEVPKDGATAGAQFNFQDLETGTLKIDIKHDDLMPMDNVAYVPVNSPRPAKVLAISPRNEALRIALETDQVNKISVIEFSDPEVLDAEDQQELLQSGYYDLVIFDQCVPKKMPKANTLFIGDVPPVEGWKKGEIVTGTAVVDVDKAHPLTQMVYMDNVDIFQGFKVTAPTGGTELMTGTVGEMLMVAPRGGFEDAALGFQIYNHEERQTNTTWVIRRSFPVFVFNAIRYLGGNMGSLASASYRPGAPVSIRTEGTVTNIRVKNPRGETSKLDRAGLSSFVYNDSDELGTYQVFEGSASEPTQQFAVNLFDSQESNLTVRPAITIDNTTQIGTAGLETYRLEFWKWLLIIGLGVLVFEWYIYNKRVYL